MQIKTHSHSLAIVNYSLFVLRRGWNNEERETSQRFVSKDEDYKEDFEIVKDFYKYMIPQKWTYTARKCYKIGCICSKCYEVPDDLKSECKMKFAVIKLVEKYGKPKKE